MLYAKANLCFRGSVILQGAHLPADVTAAELDRWRECDAVGVVPVVEVPEPPQPPAVVVADLSPVIAETVGRFVTIESPSPEPTPSLPPSPEPPTPAADGGGKEEAVAPAPVNGITPAGDDAALSGEAEPPKPAGVTDAAITPPAGATGVPAAITTPPAVTTPQPQTQPNRPHGHGHDRKRR